MTQQEYEIDVRDLMKFEDGEMDEQETIDLFQKLIDTGTAWQLQGSYGRTAAALIANGFCKTPQKESTN